MTPDYAESFSLYTARGHRKYLNAAERQRALTAMATLEPGEALFALTLALTGARVSEVLALTPASFQVEFGVIAFQTLKRRKHSVREMPIPAALMQAISHHFTLTRAVENPKAEFRRLWPFCRVTGWRIVKHVMALSQVSGCRACPRGLRHSFAIHAVRSGVPLHLVQRWLGHASVTTTAIYLQALGDEEREIAARMWIK